MIKRLISRLITLRINSVTKKKFGRLKKNITPLDNKSAANIELEYLKKWSKFRISPFKRVPDYYAGINKNYSPNYVPENIYYGEIEPRLNNRAFATAYADKNFYERYFSDHSSLFPDTILRGINGNIFDKNFNPLNPDRIAEILKDEKGSFIIKPAIETGGGANVLLAELRGPRIIVGEKDLSITEFQDLLSRKYQVNFVFQRRIKQNNYFADFNESSLNTIRLYTYRREKTEEIVPLHAVLRFGKPKSIVDNQASGGLSIGINSSGELNDFAIDKYGSKYNNFDFLNTKAGKQVPCFEPMIQLAKKLGPKYQFQRLLGFDFCVDENNTIRLLEINCKNIEVNFLQLNNGPLFGEYTDEIIAYSLKNKKSVVLDFYV